MPFEALGELGIGDFCPFAFGFDEAISLAVRAAALCSPEIGFLRFHAAFGAAKLRTGERAGAGWIG